MFPTVIDGFISTGPSRTLIFDGSDALGGCCAKGGTGAHASSNTAVTAHLADMAFTGRSSGPRRRVGRRRLHRLEMSVAAAIDLDACAAVVAVDEASIRTAATERV